jgi:hypothetical protein
VSPLDKIKHESGTADLHRGRPLRHIRIADDDVKPSVSLRVSMRFISGIDDRPTVHRVDRAEHAEEIRSLGELVDARLTDLILSLDPELSRAGEDLTRDQERHDIPYESIPRNMAAHQIVVVTAVAVAYEVRVVFVQSRLLAFGKMLIPAPRALR